ncbi:MAG: hypothetical protein NTV63_05325 [Candidatus Woesearchaeota archaeon]|nr:hypothetical protein [Candidatus Woesearchaeota archaeon]
MKKAKCGKKGDIAIGTIVSILIAIVGITTALIITARSSDGKKMYCGLVNKYAPKFYDTRMGSFCRDSSEHEISFMKSEKLMIDKFSDENTGHLSIMSKSVLSDNFSIFLERETNLLSAELSISTGSERKLRRFPSGKENESLPPFPRNGGERGALINISKYALINSASIELVGSNYPGSVDIAFAIDTSGSMTEEWNSVCDVIKKIGKNLSDFGVKDFRIRVYAIGEGATSGSCISDRITNAELKAVSAINFIEEGPSRVKSGTPDWGATVYYFPGDQYEEAWALAASHLSKNVDWKEKSKKMIILIGDSDPTGALGTEYHYGAQAGVAGKWSNPSFTGNEQDSIDNAKSDSVANDAYVSVVFGNEDLSNDEGFNVGCSINPDDSCCQNNPLCSSIMGWMEELSTSTRGAFVAYIDTPSLQKSVMDAVMSLYPSGIIVSINNFEIANHPGSLNRSNLPWLVSGDIFKNTLQDALSSCEPDDFGYCMIPINVSSDTDGTIILTNLQISYELQAHDVSVSIIDGDSENEIFRIALLSKASEKFSFTNEMEAIKKGCKKDLCRFNFTVETSNPTEIFLSNLSIKYKKYYLREELLNAIAECWKKAEFGQLESDIICLEFPIPEDYIFYRATTEKDIAELLVKRKWCHIIADSEYECGEEDNLDFKKDINSITNVLIEYKSSGRKIIVS